MLGEYRGGAVATIVGEDSTREEVQIVLLRDPLGGRKRSRRVGAVGSLLPIEWLVYATATGGGEAVPHLSAQCRIYRKRSPPSPTRIDRFVVFSVFYMEWGSEWVEREREERDELRKGGTQRERERRRGGEEDDSATDATQIQQQS